MRERLVEAMARALYEQFAADDISCTYCSWELLGDKQSWRDRALPALDAALDLLVAETMAQFDEQIAVYETKKDQAWKADMQERFDRFENYRDAADHMRGRIDDMLATLRSPKI